MKWLLWCHVAALLLELSAAGSCSTDAAIECYAKHGLSEMNKAMVDPKYFFSHTFSPNIQKMCWEGESLTECIKAAAQRCGENWERSLSRYMTLVLKQVCFTDKINWADWKETRTQTCRNNLSQTQMVFAHNLKCAVIYGMKDLFNFHQQDRNVCRKIDQLVHCSLAAALKCGRPPFGFYAQEMTRIKWRAFMATVLKPYTEHPFNCRLPFGKLTLDEQDVNDKGVIQMKGIDRISYYEQLRKKKNY